MLGPSALGAYSFAARRARGGWGLNNDCSVMAGNVRQHFTPASKQLVPLIFLLDSANLLLAKVVLDEA